MKRLVIILALLVAPAFGTNAPVLFFSDLILGPNTGNSDTTYVIPSGSTARGVYVTLYGNYLSNYSSIALGSCAVTVVSAPATYLWYQKMSVMIGNNCSTGNWSITTPGGTWSGPMISTTKETRTYDFTVVTGSIYYLSSSGNNSNAGTFSAPWLNVYQAVGTMTSGSVTYALNGFSDTRDNGEGGVINPTPSQCADSTATTPPIVDPSHQIAIGAYPGATVTIGPTSTGAAAFSTDTGQGTCGGYEVFGMALKSGTPSGSGNAVGVYAGGGTCPTHCVYNMRFVGNSISCPNAASSQTGCFGDGGGGGGSGDPSVVYGIVIYGEYAYDTAATSDDTLYHVEYHGTTSSIMEGWGYLTPQTGGSSNYVCNGIQMYTSNGSFVSADQHIHDMEITGDNCQGILMGLNVDPQTVPSNGFGGGAEMYNNVIWNTGSSNDPYCMTVAALQPSSPSTNVLIYNNTLYDCGTQSAASGAGLVAGYYASGCTSSTCEITATNNIIYPPSTATYYTQANYCCDPTNAPNPTGVNNDLYGLGSISGSNNTFSITSSLNVNPTFVNTSSSPPNLSLQSSSALIGAGSTTLTSTYDINGLKRPSPPSIGAYEYAAGSNTCSVSGSTYTAASVNYTDVEDCESLIAANGATLVIPSGTATWGNGTSAGVQSLALSNYSQTIQGAGSGSTHIIVDEYSTFGDNAINCGITTTCQGISVRITGIDFQLETIEPFGAILMTGGTGISFRIDHSTCEPYSSSPAYGRWFSMRMPIISPGAVADHNTASDCGYIVENVQSSTDSSDGNHQSGSTAWAGSLPAGIENVNMFYDENNTWSNPHYATQQVNIGDCDDGAAIVTRYSSMTDDQIGNHGYDSVANGCMYRGANNNTVNPNAIAAWGLQSRGGTGMDWNNYFESSATGQNFGITDYRSANGSGNPTIHGYCDGTTTDETGSGDPYYNDQNTTPTSTYQGWHCAEQIGQGPPFGPGGSSSPAFTSYPLYEWNNCKVAIGCTPGGSNQVTIQVYAAYPSGTFNYTTTHIAQNRDYYDQVSGFNGTTGVGTGVLASRPSTCTTGVLYFATDQGSQGEGFLCTATNTWGSSAYYLPYTYPHPLDTGGTYSFSVVNIAGSGTVTSSDSVIDCTTGTTGTCSDPTASGTVTLTFTASPGYTLRSATGCTLSSNTCSVTTTATITATFVPVAMPNPVMIISQLNERIYLP